MGRDMHMSVSGNTQGVKYIRDGKPCLLSATCKSEVQHPFQTSGAAVRHDLVWDSTR